MELLTRHSDLIVLLSRHLRRNDCKVLKEKRIRRLFERLCGRIIEDRGLDVLELPLERIPGLEYPTPPFKVSLNAYLDFEDAHNKSIDSAIIDFVNLAFVHIAENQSPDFVPFNICVGWFLGALGWHRSLLVPVIKSGSAMLVGSKEFAAITNYKVRVPVSVEYHDGNLIC